jgi:catechol 2,3-dioxygenase-like lactoylglutathione lyase family enzyme
MQGLRLDHATIDTADVEGSIAFYRHFLNLRPGSRPDFDFHGAWLYPEDGDYAILHLVERHDAQPGGRLNHIAFRGRDLAGYLEKVKASGQWFRVVGVPGTDLTQVHHFDPNQVKIEILFDEPLDR